MCGIVGLSLYQQNNREKDFGALKRLFTNMLLAAQERGSAATGVVLINKGDCVKKTNIYVLRAPLCSKDIVQTNEYKELQNKFGRNTLSIIGHTRAVSGSLKEALNNNNNHPHLCGSVIGVHNGNIINDTVLWDRYRDKFSRRGGCDSEVIFSLLNYNLSNSKDEYSAVIKTLTELSGWWAIAAVDLNAPTRILLAKDFEAPLSVGWLTKQKTAVFASKWKYIKNDDAIRHKFSKNTLIVLDSSNGGKNYKFSFEEKKIHINLVHKRATDKICAI